MSLEGFLHKLGDKGLVKAWKHRFFEYDEDSKGLNYFAAKGSEKLGMIPLANVSTKPLNTTVVANRKLVNCGFALETKTRKYFLCAETPEERDRWVRELSSRWEALHNPVVEPSWTPPREITPLSEHSDTIDDDIDGPVSVAHLQRRRISTISTQVPKIPPESPTRPQKIRGKALDSALGALGSNPDVLLGPSSAVVMDDDGMDDDDMDDDLEGQREVEKRRLEDEKKKREEEKRRSDEEEERKKREDEERKKREEEEKKKREDEEKKKREDEEKKKREDEEKKREDEEKKKREDEERKKREDEERKKREDEKKREEEIGEEEKKREDEERVRREEEERKKREEEEKKEKEMREDEERKKRKEEKKKEEKKKKRVDEEEKKRVEEMGEEEEKKKEDERVRREEEEKKKEEERREEEEKKRVEDESKKREEEERKEEEEKKKRVEEEKKKEEKEKKEEEKDEYRTLIQLHQHISSYLNGTGQIWHMAVRSQALRSAYGDEPFRTVSVAINTARIPTTNQQSAASLLLCAVLSKNGQLSEALGTLLSDVPPPPPPTIVWDLAHELDSGDELFGFIDVDRVTTIPSLFRFEKMLGDVLSSVHTAVCALVERGSPLSDDDSEIDWLIRGQLASSLSTFVLHGFKDYSSNFDMLRRKPPNTIWDFINHRIGGATAARSVQELRLHRALAPINQHSNPSVKFRTFVCVALNQCALTEWMEKVVSGVGDPYHYDSAIINIPTACSSLITLLRPLSAIKFDINVSKEL